MDEGKIFLTNLPHHDFAPCTITNCRTALDNLVKNENLPDLVKNRQSSVQSSVSGGVLGIIDYIII